MRALAIRLRLGVPQAESNLRRVAGYRGELGPEHFSDLLTQATAGTGMSAETIMSLVGQLDGPTDAT